VLRIRARGVSRTLDLHERALALHAVTSTASSPAPATSATATCRSGRWTMHGRKFTRCLDLARKLGSTRDEMCAHQPPGDRAESAQRPGPEPGRHRRHPRGHRATPTRTEQRRPGWQPLRHRGAQRGFARAEHESGVHTPRTGRRHSKATPNSGFRNTSTCATRWPSGVALAPT
jgi:hypothetical protein